MLYFVLYTVFSSHCYVAASGVQVTLCIVWHSMKLTNVSLLVYLQPNELLCRVLPNLLCRESRFRLFVHHPAALSGLMTTLNTFWWSDILCTASDFYTNSYLLAHLRKVGGIPYPVHHLLAFGVYGSHMGPHPLPGHALNRESSPVDIEQNPSVFLLFLTRGPGAVVWRRGAGVLLGAAAKEAVRAGALGAAVPAQLGWGGAGSARGVWSRHWLQEMKEEELGQENPPQALRASLFWSAVDGTFDLKG